MIIYNVTINIDNDIREEWLNWMRTVHIPDVMKTGFFLEYRICKVLVEEEQGTTYSIQYSCASMKDMEDYQREHAQGFQKEISAKYGSKLVAFRTLLEVI